MFIRPKRNWVNVLHMDNVDGAGLHVEDLVQVIVERVVGYERPLDVTGSGDVHADQLAGVGAATNRQVDRQALERPNLVAYSLV